eukprot:Gregarina_sp_Poly_1__1139@NODE_1279_length_4511_cov_34_076508_g85_i1_p2_GENE_NODE_1279_length_4511_cov_34_076508_g85_i1NODE_1279_length_4511_cov_34_076508_g85_i1_p2_ORF_typecomplete_len203_score47_41p25alpha/PF05517_12/8_4e34_NODE_1279_length_4511_cov_34_076508_g85_i124423050
MADAKGGPLEEIFLRYSNFGVGQNKVDHIDNSKFFKLAKESELIDEKLTRAAVDISFQKIMKRQRKMNFDQFKQCLDLMAKRKEVTYDEMVNLICEHGGPKKNNVTEFADDEWVHKQTNPELYTGMHKYRFDQEGKGRGIEGRRSEMDVADPLAHLLDRSNADIRGRKVEEVERREREQERQAAILAKKQEEELASAHVREA